MKKYGVWKDVIILKARIWVRNETILYLYTNAVGKVIMEKVLSQREREREVSSHKVNLSRQ